MKRNDLVALVDCNNFYASCERVFDPTLADKPIGILSNNDGIIVALSNELKALGIKRGDAAFKLDKRLLKQHDVRLFSSNYTLYGDMSARVMQVLSSFTPELEIYSIDEAFLSLRGFEDRDLTAYAAQIRRTVQQWLGLPVSVGVARSKTLAKVANRVAKKFPATGGVYNLVDHPRMDKVLSWVGVGDVWGVGPQYAKMLRKQGIETAWQLSQSYDAWVQKKMTIVGLRTVRELRGISCIDLELDVDPKKEIISSKSFGTPVTELKGLQEAAAAYCTRAVEKLRSEHQVASSIMVYLTTNRFKEEPQYANYQAARLPVPSAYTPDFLVQVRQLLDDMYRPGFNYKKVGVMLSNITHQSAAPLDFFAPTYLDDERKVVMDCLDAVNRRWGSNTLRYAAVGVQQSWQMKRQFLSPHYTTRWSDLPIVRAV
jgi:DNA polymerase V